MTYAQEQCLSLLQLTPSRGSSCTTTPAKYDTATGSQSFAQRAQLLSRFQIGIYISTPTNVA